MKILAIGDPHAKIDNSREITLLTEKLVHLISREQPDVVIVMGDLAHNFARMYLPAWKSIIAFMDGISSVSKKMYYIVGNHDYINNSQYLTDDHFFTVFQSWKGRSVDIVERPTWHNEILMVPYVYPGRFSEMLEKDTPGDFMAAKAIFCHQEFKNSKMGGILSTNGDVWHPDMPMVYNGHIHDRDLLQKNILNIGAPYQTSFGDGSVKSVEMIYISGKKIKSEPIDLHMPKKITHKLTSDKFKSFSKDTIKAILNSEDKHRIIITGTYEEMSKLRKSKEYKELAQKVKIVPKYTDTFKRKTVHNKSFEDIFAEVLKKESLLVQQECEEVMRNVYKA